MGYLPAEKSRKLEQHLGVIGNTIAFFASAIKSGENWSATCDRDKKAAHDAMDAIRAVMAEPAGFLDRLKAEHEELRQRINKLAAFIGSAPYDLLPIRQQNLLGHQINAMREYRDVLSDRLKDLERTASREAETRTTARQSDEPGAAAEPHGFAGEELGDGVRMTGPDHSNDAPEFNR